MRERWSLNGIEEILDLEKNGSGWRITLGEGDNKRQVQVLDISLNKSCLLLKLHNETVLFYCTKNSNGSIWISSPTRDSHIEQIISTKKRGSKKEEGLLAPMPGIILAHKTTPGTPVKKGEPLLVMEAMKMEYTINATHDGILKRFCFAVGEKAPLGALLAELE